MTDAVTTIDAGSSSARRIVALNLPAVATAAALVCYLALSAPFARADRLVVFLFITAVYATALTGLHVVVRLLRHALLRGRSWTDGYCIEWSLYVGCGLVNALSILCGYRDAKTAHPRALATLGVAGQTAIMAVVLGVIFLAARRAPWRLFDRWCYAIAALLAIVPLMPSDRLATRAATTGRPPAAVISSDRARHSSGQAVLVGLDGVDDRILDKLIQAGRLPTLARFAAAGFRASLDNRGFGYSPIVWNSIATGVTAERHGIYSFSVTRIRGLSRPIDSWLARMPPALGIKSMLAVLRKRGWLTERLAVSTDRRQVALWQVLSHYDRSCLTLNYLQSFPPT